MTGSYGNTSSKTTSGLTPIGESLITVASNSAVISNPAGDNLVAISGTVDHVLTSNGAGVAPSFKAVPSTSSSLSGGTTGQIVYQSAPSTTAFAGPGAADEVLMSNGVAAPSYQKVKLGTSVQGTLPVANGGTGVTTSTGTGAVVRQVSPSLTTPDVGVATASKITVTGGDSCLTANATINPIRGTTSVTLKSCNITLANTADANNIVIGMSGNNDYAWNQPGAAQIITQQPKSIFLAPNTVIAMELKDGGDIAIPKYPNTLLGTGVGGLIESKASTGTGSIVLATAPTLSNTILTNDVSLPTATFTTLVTDGLNLLSGVGPGASGTVLTSTGVGSAPSYQAIPISTPSNISGGTVGQVVYQSAPSTTAFAGPGAADEVLMSNGVAAPSYQKVKLGTSVQGTLPVANGGTGVTASTGTGSNVLSTSPTITTASLTTPTVSTPIINGKTRINGPTNDFALEIIGPTVASQAGLTITATSNPNLILTSTNYDWPLFIHNATTTRANYIRFFNTAGSSALSYIGQNTAANLYAMTLLTTLSAPINLQPNGVTEMTLSTTGIKLNSARYASSILGVDASGNLTNNASSGTGSIVRASAPTISSATLDTAVTLPTVGFFKTLITDGSSAVKGISTVTAGYVLTSNGILSEPTYQPVAATAFSGTLAVADGGTGVTTSTGTTNVVLSNSPTITSPTLALAVNLSYVSGNNILVADGSKNIVTVPYGTAGLPLISSGTTTAPTFGQVNLTSGVTGVLPYANGGRPQAPNLRFFTASSGTYTPSAGCTYIEVTMVGSGGGGAGGATATPASYGIGGGAGGVVTSIIAAASYGYILGSGGAGGAGGVVPSGGADGSLSQFFIPGGPPTILIEIPGGKGGSISGFGGEGSVQTIAPANSFVARGGGGGICGGSSFFGGGGYAGGGNGEAYGGGGGGGHFGGSPLGGSGSPGCVAIKEYYN